MEILLKFLIYRTRTVDGKKGTADKLLEHLNNESIRKYKALKNKTLLSDSTISKIAAKNEHSLFRKVYLKYMVMKIRQKISYIALTKKQSLLEVFLKSIYSSYKLITLKR